jgi:hypothetical protein
MTSARRSRSAFGFLVAVLAVVIAACGGGSNDRAATQLGSSSATQVAAPPSSPSAIPSVPETVGPEADGVTLDVYFLRADQVGVGHRRIAPTPSVARAATQLLLAGPTADERAAGLSSAIPSDTQLRNVDLADGVLTVDLSKEFVANADAPTMQQRLAQLVFTLTQFETVTSVRLRLDGVPTTTFGTSLDRAAFAAETPRILLETPAPGDVLKDTAHLAGVSSTYENNVRIRIVGADGRTLADTFTTAKASPAGAWSPFDAIVPFARGANTTGKVVVFENSAKDGSEINVVEVPVRFA